MFDFWAGQPESVHQVTILMSDRGIPRSPAHMNGYGSHTFSMWNKEGERHWVKFHFKSCQGLDWLSDAKAAEVIGQTRESYQEELWNMLEEGRAPKWTLFIQVMTEEEATQTEYNPFDLTKVWPHKDFPLIEVGELVMDTMPENYFQMVENAAFNVNNVVPGIGFSPDKMLQARIFSYADAHRYRVGTHYEALPPNAPKNAKVNHYHKDGAMRFFTNDFGNPDAYYEPNEHDGPVADETVAEPPLRVDADAIIARHEQKEDEVDYIQPRALYLDVMNDEERDRLHKNMAGGMAPVSNGVKERWLSVLNKVHPDYEAGVRKALETGNHGDPSLPVTDDTPLTASD